LSLIVSAPISARIRAPCGPAITAKNRARESVESSLSNYPRQSLIPSLQASKVTLSGAAIAVNLTGNAGKYLPCAG
jgi:hypothetical protein